MPGKAKNDQTKSRKEDIAALKAQCIEVYAALGVKKAAAAAVRRTLKRVNEWEDEDEQFRLDMLGAEYRFLAKNQRKVKLDNVFANLFDEYKPPVTRTEHTGKDGGPMQVQTFTDLIAAAAKEGDGAGDQPPAGG